MRLQTVFVIAFQFTPLSGDRHSAVKCPLILLIPFGGNSQAHQLLSLCGFNPFAKILKHPRLNPAMCTRP